MWGTAEENRAESERAAARNAARRAAGVPSIPTGPYREPRTELTARELTLRFIARIEAELEANDRADMAR